MRKLINHLRARHGSLLDAIFHYIMLPTESPHEWRSQRARRIYFWTWPISGPLRNVYVLACGIVAIIVFAVCSLALMAHAIYTGEPEEFY